MNNNKKGILLGLLAYAIYASHDALVKDLGGAYSPFQILFFSMLFGFPMVALQLIRDTKAATLRPRHPWWLTLRMGSMLISTISTFYAFSVLPLAQTYSILFAIPLWVTLLSVPFLGERVGIHRGGAVLLGLIGVLIVVRPGAQELHLGHFSVMIGSFFSALNAIIVRKIGRDERDVVIIIFPMLSLFIVMALLLPINYIPMPIEDLGKTAAVSLLSFLALNCIVGAYKAGEASIVAPMLYSQIIWATLYGFYLFGEVPDQQTYIGAAVIIFSGLYIVFRESRGNTSANTPVLRTRTRFMAGPALRVSHFLRARKPK
ncbi:DMT family transporter [Terasakiella pusilla]|jgi:drug/metabolite transporter (DMT)-like permease|uniref:DMT family transporter n=1 Tax=Terasakiella pusilla TaxID=64973 RepID=UPI000490ABE2|nr:DMT family transporter [Terasakiella pusilla]